MRADQCARFRYWKITAPVVVVIAALLQNELRLHGDPPETHETGSFSDEGGARASVSVTVDQLARLIPADFDGFSIEVDDAAQKYLGPSGSPNLVFYQLLKKAASGCLGDRSPAWTTRGQPRELATLCFWFVVPQGQR